MRAAGILSLLLAAALGIATPQTTPMEGIRPRAVASASLGNEPARNGVENAKAASTRARKAQEPLPEPVNSYLRMPLDFEVNRGQAPAAYPFVAHGPSYALGISSTGLAVALHTHVSNAQGSPQDGLISPPPTESSNLELRLVGARSDALVSGVDSKASRSNYFVGNDPGRWRTSVPHFSRVRIASVYSGIDLVFYGNPQQLEYDFAVAPGADPEHIQLRAEGAQAVTLNSSGDAIFHTAAGDVQLLRPVAYQQIAGVRHAVESAFRVVDGQLLQFALGNYDHSQELVIDPVLVYGLGVGGSNWNQGLGLAVDSAGNAYVSGLTCSSDFPSTPGTFGTLPTDASKLADCDSAFVVKFDPTGSSLIYSDFIGGTSYFSAGGHLAVDSSGNVFLAGATAATDFPTVLNIGPAAAKPCNIESGGENCPVGFILKLSPDGSQLLFSSLLGGSQSAMALQAKLDPVTGDLVVLGETNSSNFLPAPTTLQTAFGGGTCANSVPCFDSFLLGLNPATGALRYGTFIGGAGNDWGSGLAFDKSGNIYLSGSTQAPLSTSLGAVTHTYAPSGGAAASGQSLFVAKLNLSGNQLSPGYLALIQGDGDTAASSIALDGSGNIYLGGATAAHHLPVTTGAFQNSNKGILGSSCLWAKIAQPILPNPCGAGLVGKLDTTGALSFLTYLGGSGQDMVQAIGVDSSGDVWLGGVTSSTDFPLSSDKYTAPGLGYFSPFLAEMSNDGTHLPFATLLGAGPGMASDLIVDSNNNVYIAGFSSTLLTTPGVYPQDPAAFSPAFVQKWGPGAAPAISISSAVLSFGDVAIGAASQPQMVTIRNTGAVPMELGIALGSGILGDDANDYLLSTNCGNWLAATSSCTVNVTFQPGPPSAACLPQNNCITSQRAAAILVSNNAPQGLQTIQLGGTAGIGPSVSVSPNPIVFPSQAAGIASTALYVQIGNAGDSELFIGSIALSGPNASDFQLSQTGAGGPPCSAGVLAGSYCDVYLTFTPPAGSSGARTASLTMTDTAGDSPQVVSVTGTVSAANALIISPLTLPIGPVAFGTSTLAVLKLQNPSATNDIQVTTISFSGTNQGDFSVAPASCSVGASGTLPMTVTKGSTCYVDVTFNPAAGASGQRLATLTVGTTPAIAGLPTVFLQGDAVTNSQPGMSIFTVPDPMNFGALQVGETSNTASVLFNLFNKAPIPCAGGAATCGAPLVISSIAAGLSDYTLVPGGATGCTTFPATIPIDGNCTYALQFKPSQAGARNTTVTIQSNDPQGPVQLQVFGSGLTLPLGEFLQTALNFGNSAIGVASPALTTTLLNGGLSALNVSAVTATANFAVSANTCTASLAPQATCTISITFTPPSAGLFAGTLTITDNGGFAKQQTVNLTGMGATGPQLRLMPPTLNFGNQTVNTISAAQTVTLTSTGDTAVTFPANAIRSSTDFILLSTTCGVSLPSGASCSASIQFKPTTTVFPESGTLLITDNSFGSPQPVYMQGTGVPGTGLATTTALASSLNPSVSGQSVTFSTAVSGPAGSTTAPTGLVTFLDGATTLGTGNLSSGSATFSTSSLAVGSHTITASYGGDANFSGSTSTALTQVVNAAAKLATTTTLTSSQSPSAPGQSVTLSATVAGPTGSTTTPTGTVTFLDGAASLGTGTLNGSATATLTTSTLTSGSHSITAEYGGDGTFAGSTSSILTQVVGTPSFSISVTPTTVTLTAGASGTATVSVTPSSGFNQQVSFACSGLPAASTCAFSPATVTPNGSSAATSTVTVATDVTTAVRSTPNLPGHRRSLPQTGTLVALILLGIGGVVRTRRGAGRLFYAVVLLAGLCLGVTSCGGSGSKNSGSKTPAGTSAVTVTATSGSLNQSTTFMLVVQ